MAARPLAYGYLSVEGHDEGQIERLHDLVTAHAMAEDLALEEVFVDRDIPAGQISGRPAFATVTALVDEGEGVYVVVPSMEAVSPSVGAQRAIAQAITSRGGHLIVASGAVDDRIPVRKPGASYVCPRIHSLPPPALPEGPVTRRSRRPGLND